MNQNAYFIQSYYCIVFYLVSKRTFPHLPRQWYEKIGIAMEHNKDENMTETVENQLTSSCKPHIFSGHKTENGTVEGYLYYNQESYSINQCGL